MKISQIVSNKNLYLFRGAGVNILDKWTLTAYLELYRKAIVLYRNEKKEGETGFYLIGEGDLELFGKEKILYSYMNGGEKFYLVSKE